AHHYPVTLRYQGSDPAHVDPAWRRRRRHRQHVIESRSIAIGYKDGGNWVSEGWWNADSGECKVVVQGNLKNRYYYYMAESNEGWFDGQDYMFCTETQAFTIIGDENCQSRGYEESSFRQIDTGQTATSYTLTLTATGSSGSSSADGSRSGDDGSSGGGSRRIGAEPRPSLPSVPQVTLPRSSGGAAAPGTYGEPISITGSFQGCDPIDGTMACKVESEGWLYTVFNDDRTPTAVFNQLMGFPDFSTVTVAGDMIAQGDIHVDITAREVTLQSGGGGGGTAMMELRNQLVGLWQAYDDPNVTLRFTGAGERIEYYAGDQVDRGTFTVGTNCSTGGPGGDPIVEVMPFDYPEPSCYGLLSVTRDNLTLIFLPRGNSLNYYRVN
ncbi:MAG: DUF1036 domain-containing protein, partial [Rhodospirillaceae bacterium]